MNDSDRGIALYQVGVYPGSESRQANRSIVLASLLIFVLFLTGCAGMPLTTMYKLHKMEPMEIDPAQFKIAIRADERIGIRKDGVRISLKFDAEDGSLHIDDTYIVEITRNPIMTSELLEERRPGESVTVFQLSDSDAQKMTRAQTLIKPYSEGAGRGSLSFGVDLQGACVYSALPAGKMLIDIFIQATYRDGFFVFNKDLNLRGSSAEGDAVFENLPLCPDSRVNSNHSEIPFR